MAQGGLDNYRSHKTVTIKDVSEEVGADLVFIPAG